MERDEFLEVVQGYIDEAKFNGSDISRLSDGWHTFNEWASNYRFNKNKDFSHQKQHYNVHKSRRHNSGELCFGGGWFIVCAKLPSGLISNHYKAEDWDLFKIPEVEKALFPFDGHTGQDVIERLLGL